jgi:DNA-binding NarL/FixJ family response regulator
MLEHGAVARILPNNRLEFIDASTALEFRQAFSECLKGLGVAAIELHCTPSIHITLAQDIWCREPAITALLRGAPSARTLPTNTVAETLRISLSEARLAVLLCDGHSLASAATEIGWTIETARSCSKQIFARTGTYGQTNLVRKMLNSSMWLQHKMQT